MRDSERISFHFSPTGGARELPDNGSRGGDNDRWWEKNGVNMATTMPSLLPASTGVQFTARPSTRLRDQSRLKHVGSSSSHAGSPVASDMGVISPNGSMSSIEVEALLREKVDKNPNGTVKYSDFLDKFYGQDARISSPEKRVNGPMRFMPPTSAREINIDMIEKMLKDRIANNMKAVVKALQLFDYNRDGKVQRHELRRVLDNYCFKLSDSQFDKLWMRYDFHHTGQCNYKQFLERMGVSVAHQSRPPPQDGAKGALLWPQKPVPPAMGGVVLKQRKEDEQAIQKMGFDQIEAEFRLRMRRNYLNLKKMFISFDRNLDGFIQLDDLKSILIQFTLPMSDPLFKQLMERCNVRGTGKISWEAFLEKFQDAQAPGNGQTLPIKPGHKFFPIREEMQKFEVEDIWRLLYKHVHNHYHSIKQAFLQFDISRKGRVTRKELRNIIEKFTFRLDDQQFKQLMLKLDPEHTNNISYHQFLGLFEETESLAEGHKWLNSVHRFNENPKPAIMAWETVEEILREKITENWKSVSGAIVDFDHKDKGYITQQQMKKVIDDYVLPISDQHFSHMLQRCEDCGNSKVNYVEFLEKLHVDVTPGDLLGLSTQIHDESHVRENFRCRDQLDRQIRNIRRAKHKTDNMTADEVMARLKDRMSQHKMQIRQAFLSFDKSGKGKVNKRNFREVLAGMGMPMADDHFQDLVSQIGFRNGSMMYSDFVQAFEDPRNHGPGDDVQRSGNHHVNPIRGDEYGMSADEVEKRLLGKLRENFANLRAAFYKFDDDHNGILTKSNFRRLLDSFMCIMSDNEYEVLCKRMGIDTKSRITYEDFLRRFEIRDTAEGHKWLNSVHRYNDTQPTSELTATEVHGELKRKVHQQWKDIAGAFISIDSRGKGIITKRDLRDLLFRFVLPMSPEEFKSLWAMYDSAGKGFLSHKDFLAKLGTSEFTPTDIIGTSSKIINDSKQYIIDHNKQQLGKHQRITQHQAERVMFMSAEEVERQLRDKIRDHYKDFYAAFMQYDTEKKGSLSVKDVQKVLTDLNFFMNDEEFFLLLDRIGLPTNRSRLNYDAFLRAFEDGRKSAYGNRTPEFQVSQYMGITPQEAEGRLREMVSKNYDLLSRAFAAFDKHSTQLIPLADFRRTLDIFMFKLTDAQWKYLKSRLQITEDQVNYLMFLDNNTLSGSEDAERWLTNLTKTINAQTPSLNSMEEIQTRLKETVAGHFNTLARAFSDLDYAGIGVVTKEDFKEVINKTAFRITEEQFDNLMAYIPTNEFGNIDYKQFMKQFSTGPEEMDKLQPLPQRPASTLMGRRPQSRAMSRSMTQLDMRKTGTRMSRGPSRMATPMINAESGEQQLKDVIFRHWKEVQRLCRNQDRNNTGTIPNNDILEIFDKFGVQIPQHDLSDLLTKYDIQEDGTFSYVDFLRHFIINLKPGEQVGSSMSRKQIPQTRVTTETGPTSNQFYEAMVRVRDCVMQNWKEMRRNFRSIDPGNSGNVEAVDFRRVLRQFNMNLSEEEFYHLVSYYDKSLEGTVNYNDFIRAYLQYS
ncbi:EF-hand calcium-binding domain-containing protein 6 [Mizuhopecten yessoensis]|uniref:EF-hand calcium-binding domain-containing protein 6 n=2 Tax=Mizuhopecten yessoensis TaxID=6573 RepID=A0A210QIB7_MIZYE|nr:EF-hand calcium-binding domain-containing protein 6 [Mizuhopecten yessoensis]